MPLLQETARRELMLAKVKQLSNLHPSRKLLQRSKELLRGRSSHLLPLMTRRRPARDSAGPVMKPAWGDWIQSESSEAEP